VNAPLVTVILPVLNGERTLRQALDSLCRQTERCFELLIILNGASDGSPLIAEEYARRDARIRILSLARASLVTALNAGLTAARAPYIARMDCDDTAMPERLEAQLRHLEEHPDIDVVSCRVEFGAPAGCGGGFARYVAWSNSLLTHDDMMLARFVEAPLVHPTIMIRRGVLADCGGWRDGDFPEDYELWLRLMARGVRFEKLPMTLLKWNDSPARLSRTDPRYASDAFYRLKAAYLAAYLRSAAGGREIWVWGAGRPTRKRAEKLREHGQEIASWVDIDPHKIGRCLNGIRVAAPDALPGPDASFVVTYVASWGARERAAAHLARSGYRPGDDCIAAA